MKAVITGGAGFLGQKLARALLNEGHEVTLLVRNPENVPKDLPVSTAQG
ncbi:NAD-dependent epimerase/dehydratase family protein, partial [Vibrio parahaemolyticus]